MAFLFISHKHADRRIAEELARFIRARSGGKIKVHLSSSPDFQGPRFGPSLNAQLREALWQSEVVVLLYTSEDQDWSYCMWECGMATHPASPNTSLVVFQCGLDVPSPFQDVRRVNPRNKDDIKMFVSQLLREPDLFPKSKAILPDLNDMDMEELAAELHNRLNDKEKALLPNLDSGEVEQWPAWPYLRLELPCSQADKIVEGAETDDSGLCRRIVSEHASVARYDATAAHLFAKRSLPSDLKFYELLEAWREAYPTGDTGWFDSCCEQIMVCVRRGFPLIATTSMREVDGDSSFTPVVTKVQRLPFGGTVQFEVYFFNLSDPRSVLVTARMTPISEVFYKTIGEVRPESIHLRQLIQELKDRKRNRVPILNSDSSPLYIIHRSMIDQFITKNVLRSNEHKSIENLTLGDLLADPDLRPMFENSYAVVSERSTIDEAKKAMTAKEGCSDVFVTKLGTAKEAVTGLLTNVKITKNL